MKNSLLALLLLALLSAFGRPASRPVPPPGPGHFTFSPAVRDAYQKALSLRFGEARQALEQVKKAEPDNLMALLVENYLDFLGLYGGDSEGDYKVLSKNMEPRLAQIASRGDRSSPWFLYCQAEIRLQWAIVRSRQGDYLATLSDIKQAYALLEENARKFPDFIANKKSLGVMHALVGNVPDEYKWAVRALGGMSGSTEQGLRELEDVLAYARRRDFEFEDEATVMYAMLQLYLNNQGDAAWKALKNSKLQPKTNPLAAFVTATVGMRTGHNDEAIQCLQECPSGPQYAPLVARHYLLGLAKLRRLDADANKPLELFLRNYQGNQGIKEGYQKLAWHHLVQGNDNGYRSYMNYARQKGSAKTEGDQAAQREAERGAQPDTRLLRARLLFDGGYCPRAYDLLKNAAADYAADPLLHLEYTYRLARIAHKLPKTEEAVRLYQQAIEQGAKSPAYFACNAALQLGLLYEEKKDPRKAREAFQQCLSLKPEEYASSLHAQAKAGLSRLK
jgi:tetratricopeptide (TPR) repeat protein